MVGVVSPRLQGPRFIVAHEEGHDEVDGPEGRTKDGHAGPSGARTPGATHLVPDAQEHDHDRSIMMVPPTTSPLLRSSPGPVDRKNKNKELPDPN